MAVVGGGGYAEAISVHERVCIPIPSRLSWEEAAAIPEAFLSAYDALFARARLAPGEVVLVPAAASGVGTAALQIASVAGATVIALSRSPDKRRRLAATATAHVLDSTEKDLAARIGAAAGSRGVNVVLELVGAPSWPLDMEVLAEGGRIVLVGTMGGSRVEADLGVLMRKRLTVVGTVLRARPLEEKIALSRAFADRMIPLFEQGRLRPVVDRVLALRDVARAHGLVERNESFGKVVLRVGEPG
jgi:NADPH:quinone reductase-like Zn-dependent oxidoreductase